MKRQALGAGALVGVVAASFLFVAATASGPYRFVVTGVPASKPLAGWITGPLAGIVSALDDQRLILLSGVLFGLYLLVVAVGDAVRPSWAVATIVVVHVLFLLGPPQWLDDAFNYIGYARLGVLHGISPYGHTLSAVRSDAAFPYVSWRHLDSPYGPLFTLWSYLLVPLGLAGAFWTLKVAVVAASLGCLALVWRIAERLERPPVPAILFVGLNPLLLVYGVGGAHNDLFMVLALLAGVLLLLQSRPALGGGAMMAAAAIKVTAGLALPFVLVADRERRRVLLGVACAGAAVLAVSAIAFGSDLFTALTSFSDQGGYSSLRSFPGQLSQAFLARHSVSPTIIVAAQAAFGVVVVALLVLVWRGADWIAATGWATLALLLALPWVMPWYVIWLLPFAAVTGDRRLRAAALVFSAFLLVVRMPYPPYG